MKGSGLFAINNLRIIFNNNTLEFAPTNLDLGTGKKKYERTYVCAYIACFLFSFISDKLCRKKRFSALLFIITYVILSSAKSVNASQNTIDQPLLLVIDVNNIQISEALEESNPILFNQSGFQARIQCFSVNETIMLHDVKTTFILADIDLISKTEPIDRTLTPGNNVTFIQKWEIDNRVLDSEIALISGIYQVRYDVLYSINDKQEIASGPPFFVDFNANPFKSVFGVVATVSFVVTTFSGLRLLSYMSKSVPKEIELSSKNAIIKPSVELKSFYTERGASKIQSEFAKRTFSTLSNRWKKDTCPKCGVDWDENLEICSNCGTKLEEAEVLYSENLKTKAINAGREIAESVDGLTLGEIIAKVGDNITPTADILELLSFSGLVIADTRLSKEWNKKARAIFLHWFTVDFILIILDKCMWNQHNKHVISKRGNSIWNSSTFNNKQGLHG